MSSNMKKGRKIVAVANTGNSSANSNSDNESGTSNRDNREGSEEFEPGSWECTVCTFRNKYEAFKCLICDTRKGTSTRKPRLNPTVVQQQTLVQKMAVEVELKQQKKQRTSSEARNSPDLFTPSTSNSCCTPPVPISATNGKTTPSSSRIAAPSTTNGKTILKRRPIPFRDALVVRSSAKKTVIMVDGRSFTIVEFKPRISPRGRKKGSTNNKEKEPSKGGNPKPKSATSSPIPSKKRSPPEAVE